MVRIRLAGAVAVAVILAASAVAGGMPAAAQGAAGLPNLVPLAPTDLSVGLADDREGPALRFEVATANRGDWAFDLLATDTDPVAETATASQCVAWSAPRVCAAREDIGQFVVHADHGHVHFDDYARYELRRLGPDGLPDLSPAGLVATGGKVSFCLLDSARDASYGHPDHPDPHYFCRETPEGTLQGISPGWKDIYDAGLEGQQIELDGVPDGRYAVVVTADPSGRIRESDDADNVAFTPLLLSGGGSAVTAVRRLAGGGAGTVRDLAIRVCQELRPVPGTGTAVVLARDDAYADALAGAPLAAGGDACVLFTGGGPDAELDAATRAEIDRVLPAAARVWVLGGTQAVSAAAADELADQGYDVVRLQGATRYETAVAVAERVRVAQPFTGEVLLASGVEFPDAVTGGAYAARAGIPVLLTEPGALHPATAEAMSALGVSHTIVLGGSAAVSEAAAAVAPDPERVAGVNRMGTAAAIATTLWPRVVAAPGAVLAVNLEAPDAWAPALAAAPLAARLGAPQVGVGAAYPAETATWLQSLPSGVPELLLIGGADLVSEDVAAQLGADAGG